MPKAFARRLDKSLIDNLRNHELYDECLLPDIRKGNVFPAARDGYISFYHCGGNLFKFNKSGKFKTHIKYASVLKTEGHKRTYISEDVLKNKEAKPIESFVDGYARIKENCEKYSRPEGKAVSDFCKKFSYMTGSHEIVVLDIEVALSSADKKGERLDFLLFNMREKSLRFFEVKRYVNGELWGQGRPGIVEQIEEYKKELARRTEEILEAYKAYIPILRDVFQIEMPTPNTLDPNVALLVCEFNNHHKKDLKKHCSWLDEEFSVTSDIIGDIKNCKAETLWKRTTRR